MLHSKDFIRVATIIGEHKDEMTDDALASMTQQFADWLRTHNPDFDQQRFKAYIAITKPILAKRPR